MWEQYLKRIQAHLYLDKEIWMFIFSCPTIALIWTKALLCSLNASDSKPEFMASFSHCEGPLINDFIIYFISDWLECRIPLPHCGYLCIKSFPTYCPHCRKMNHIIWGFSWSYYLNESVNRGWKFSWDFEIHINISQGYSTFYAIQLSFPDSPHPNVFKKYSFKDCYKLCL